MTHPRLSRRDFLSVGALGVAGALGAAGAPAAVATPQGGPSAAQWAALAKSLRGRVVRPGDPAYATARLLYDPRFDGQRPAAVAQCASAGDVQRVVAFARAHDVALAVRCGGHSYGGYSGGTGRLVLDVTPMAAVRPASAPGGLAHVGAGARLIDVYNALGRAGQLVPGGSCPTVGIAGLTLGGGVGVFARRYGLSCDQLRAVDVVTADSVLRHCDGGADADLHWASQGGGGGNFGVAVDFTFATHAIPELTLFTYDFAFSLDAAVDVLGAWQHWNVGLDPAVWSNCQLLSGAGSPLLRVSGVACTSPATTSALLAPLLRACPAPIGSFLGAEAYLNAMMVEAGCASLSVAACHLDTTPHGQLSRQAFRASSNYVAAPMGDARLRAAADVVVQFAEALPSLGGGLVFDALGGEVNVPAPTSTAFVHRRALCSIQASFNWDAAAPSTVAAGADWLAHVRRAVFVESAGAYQNYIDPDQPDWLDAYYGENLARLERVKRRYDPDRVFDFAQAIPPAS